MSSPTTSFDPNASECVLSSVQLLCALENVYSLCVCETYAATDLVINYPSLF